jgi:hypothetical protein
MTIRAMVDFSPAGSSGNRVANSLALHGTASKEQLELHRSYQKCHHGGTYFGTA